MAELADFFLQRVGELEIENPAKVWLLFFKTSQCIFSNIVPFQVV